LQITLDRHSARLKLNYCPLPDSPNFSLPSTFKNIYTTNFVNFRDWDTIKSAAPENEKE
jgi:hypothetical protein